jgi:ADP-heptose:LPS heptosyltransferase
MHLRAQKAIDKYVGGAGIAVLRPATMLLGLLLRRDHRLTVKDEVVWLKLLGGGSLLLAMPMLLGFRRAHPGVRMVLITTPAVRPFAELMGVFDEYRIIDTGSGFRLLLSAARVWLRTLRADCLIDLEVHSRLTTVFTTLTLARNRISFWLEDIFWRRGLASHLVFFNRSSGSYHFYDRIGDFFGVAGASREECHEVLVRTCAVTAPQPIIAGRVCVGVACSDLGQERMLDASQWARAFRDNLRPAHRTFVFLGGKGDRDRTQAVIDEVQAQFGHLEFQNRCGELSLRDSVGVLYESPEFWGIDSSLLHLARIGGLRTVSYWGPTDPATRLREWSLDEAVYYRKIACSPCVHTSEEPPCRGDNRCIQGLFDAPVTLATRWTPMEYPPPPARPADVLKRAAAAVWRHIGVVCLVLALAYCVVHAFDPPRLNWGDSGSDYNVMSSGRNFAQYGFLKLRLTPILIDAAYLKMPDDRAFIYTHYPQLPDLMNGMLRAAFGLRELPQFRLVALAFAFASLFFAYRLMEWYWSKRTAQIGLALWVVNPIWIQHADYLHHAPYGFFFGLGSVYFLVRYLREARRGFLVASGLFLFVTFTASYDWWFFAPLLLALATIGHYRTVLSWRVVGTLSLLAVFGLGGLVFKFGTNAWALGGVSDLIRDLRFQAVERGTDAITRTAYMSGAWPTLYGRVERFFSLLLFPVAAFWAVLPLLRRRFPAELGAVAARANPWLLFLAALPFLTIFREIWIAQYYPTLLVVPFYAVACAAAAAALLESGRVPIKAMGAVLVAALLANSLTENASFKKAFLEPEMIRTLRAQLDSVSVPGQQIMVDHVFDAQYRYYFQRHTVALILNPPGRVELVLASRSDPTTHPRSADARGGIFVQHKHVIDQLYDKGYYYILGRYGLWRMWANPERYRAEIDALVAQRDSTLVAKVASMGSKLYETDDYVVWRIRPPIPTPIPGPTQAGSVQPPR